MNIRWFLSLFLAFLAYVVTNSLAIPLIFFIVYSLGYVILLGFKQDSNGLRIFFITTSASFIYALMLFSYMQYHNYEYLQSFDGINVYIPYTQELLNSTSFLELIDNIYNTSKYAFVGAILIPFVYIGKVTQLLDGNLYMSIQFTTMLFASFTSVVIYNILVFRNINHRKAFAYTIVYSLLSVHFIMATYIVRDMPITLFYSLLILLSLKPFTSKRILVMIAIIVAIISIRLSSGIFASIYIFVAVFLKDHRMKEREKMLSFIFIMATIAVLFFSSDLILKTFEEKSDHYAMLEGEDQGGDATVRAFDALPFGLSHLAKSAYNQFMPVPSWRTLITTSFRPESHNIMNFPNIINTLFRYIMWSVIIFSIFFRRFRKILYEDKLLFYHFIIAIIFLMVQSSTMGHRRMLGVYPIFFLVALLMYENFSKENKEQILGFSMLIFIGAQLLGVFYLI